MIGLILEGMGVGVGLAAPIGPINVEIVRRGLRGGFTAGWLVGLGAVSADTIYCALVVGGIAPIADSRALRVPLFLAGAIVLVYLGQAGVRAAWRGAEAVAAPPSARRSYLTGFAMAAANPMGIVYWLSIGGALVASAVERAGKGAAPVLVGGVFFGIVCWVTFLSGLTQGGRRFVSGQVLRWITGVSGVVLVGFGLYFGVQAVRSIGAD